MDDVEAELARLADLAPPHNPPALAAIGAARRALPKVPHIAAFDTAFYADFTQTSVIYPLPYAWYAG